ncbi:hypothetical protein E2C01_069189 [Portunus trituberculatus]|uniref:Secreted protein n=1 Tax=Portunus trituberculatus TaxID=210409 RepID=A0A5B7I247_PORTR|nr:hypothetical protein [Portunus trituberculatus]
MGGMMREAVATGFTLHMSLLRVYTVLLLVMQLVVGEPQPVIRPGMTRDVVLMPSPSVLWRLVLTIGCATLVTDRHTQRYHMLYRHRHGTLTAPYTNIHLSFHTNLR